MSLYSQILVFFKENPELTKSLVGFLAALLYATCQKLTHPDAFEGKWYSVPYMCVFQVLSRLSLVDWDKGLRSLFSHFSPLGKVTPSLDDARQSGRGLP